jgi:hypothetical protein
MFEKLPRSVSDPPISESNAAANSTPRKCRVSGLIESLKTLLSLCVYRDFTRDVLRFVDLDSGAT